MKTFLILLLLIFSIVGRADELANYLRKNVMNKSSDTVSFLDPCVGAEYKTFDTASKEQVACLNLGKYADLTAEQIVEKQRTELLESYSYEELERSKEAFAYLLDHPEKFKEEYNEKLMDKVPEKYRKFVTELAYVQVMGAAMMALIYALPEDINNWNKEELRNTPMWERYVNNIKEGPVWDHDHWAINYIGHPVSGSAYYVWARGNGLSWKESAAVSVLMSTFFWEYGWEALGEVPSIQDLIFTPLIGSMMGEGAYRLKQKILDNDGKVLGSKKLGNIACVFLDPIGELNAGIEKLVRYIGPKVHVKTSVDINHRPSYMEDRLYQIMNNGESNYSLQNVGVKVEINF